MTVRVPATTANLGPGFDCLGMALDLWNDVTVELSNQPHILVSGEGSEVLGNDTDNLVYVAAQELFRAVGDVPCPTLSIACNNNIPIARGLGSSSAAIVGGLLAANSLASQELSQDKILDLAIKLEGHPDNVTAALLGGCRIVVQDDNQVVTDEILISRDIRAIIFIPDVPMPTKDARAIIGEEFTREDVIHNLGRVALLVNSISGGHLENLAVATQDKLHQPARAKLFPAMKYIFRAARNAGALAVFLSGGGSSVMALATSRSVTIGMEMADAADKVGIGGSIKITKPSLLGAHVFSEE